MKRLIGYISALRSFPLRSVARRPPAQVKAMALASLAGVGRFLLELSPSGRRRTRRLVITSSPSRTALPSRSMLDRGLPRFCQLNRNLSYFPCPLALAPGRRPPATFADRTLWSTDGRPKPSDTVGGSLSLLSAVTYGQSSTRACRHGNHKDGFRKQTLRLSGGLGRPRASPFVSTAKRRETNVQRQQLLTSRPRSPH